MTVCVSPGIFKRNHRICDNMESTPPDGTCQDKFNVLKIRASFLSLGHLGLSNRVRFGHPRVEIRAFFDEISPTRLAMCRSLHHKFWGLGKDMHQITKHCKYHPLKTCNNDGIAVIHANLGWLICIWWWRHGLLNIFHKYSAPNPYFKKYDMKMSSNGGIFLGTGHVWG